MRFVVQFVRIIDEYASIFQVFHDLTSPLYHEVWRDHDKHWLEWPRVVLVPPVGYNANGFDSLANSNHI